MRPQESRTIQSRTVSASRVRALRLLLPLTLLLLPHLAQADQTDVIYMDNGDRVTGEIKELLLGEVLVQTTAFGDISVKWSNIQRIVSDKPMRLQKADGSYVFGQFAQTAESDMVVATEQGEESLSLDEILYLKPIKEDESLWERMDKNMLVGFSYTQASDIVRWNLGAGLKYDGLEYKTGISMQSLVTNNRTGEETRRANITAYYNRNLTGVNYWFADASIQTNDELGIDKRLIVTGGLGRFLHLSNSSEVSMQIGIAANREQSTSNDEFLSESGISYEGLIRFDWTHFKLHTPKRRITTSLDYFPGISDSGRNRVNYDINYRQEFITDLFFVIELYASYDSKPPDTAISGEDFGVITSLEFRW